MTILPSWWQCDPMTRFHIQYLAIYSLPDGIGIGDRCYKTLIATYSVTRFGEISSLCHNFTSLWANFWQFISYLAKMLSLLWQIRYIIGLIFIVANGQILKNNLTIWSHWQHPEITRNFDTWVASWRIDPTWVNKYWGFAFANTSSSRGRTSSC